ncbi:MAG TPA: alpha-glucosidase/alpha-galactosidase [Pseudolabrys sp.]|nr:alpha-glucosidase/alpha-galactosidase [Pseudolabrys sp.]
MSNRTKIVFIGATSMSFGLNMLRDVFSSDELRGSTLTLVGRNAQTLTKMTELAKLLNAKMDAGLFIEQTTDRRAAFDGASFVVNAAAIDRNRLWKLDFEVPRKHGIRHTLGENGGPGGLMFTLRTLPLVFDFVREMQEICPKALFINFSNPENRIILALGKYSPVRSLGLCHGIFMGRNDVARILGLAPEQVDVWGAGLNHSQCLMQIRHRTTGEDLYPLLRAREQDYDPSFAPLTRQLFRAFGYWMTCSDDHLGEYLAYGWEAGEHGYDFDADERGRVEFANTLDRVLAGSALPPDWLAPSGERGAAVIGGVLHDRRRVLESGIVPNRGAIPNLPDDAAVEVPVMADAAGIHPISLGPLPDPIAKLLHTQVSVQQLAVEAAVHASKEIALQALLIDPVVNSASAAVKLLDELWEVNRPYIRPCI